MKIRSRSELSDFLDQELTWRKREISNFKAAIAWDRSHLADVGTRSGVCLLYAHWEGFIKESSRAYLEYVVRKGMHLRDASINVKAVAVRERLRVIADSKRLDQHISLVEWLENGGEAIRFDVERVVEAQSNLLFAVFQNICWAVGVDPAPFEVKKNFIDLRLVGRRNKVAHGNRETIDRGDYEELHEEVIGLITAYRDALMDLASAEAFRRPSVPA